MGSFSIWHLLILAIVVFLLFGRGKISDLMGDVAKGINSFKKGLQDPDDEADKPKVISAERREAEPRTEETKEKAGH